MNEDFRVDADDDPKAFHCEKANFKPRRCEMKFKELIDPVLTGLLCGVIISAIIIIGFFVFIGIVRVVAIPLSYGSRISELEIAIKHYHPIDQEIYIKEK